MPAIPAIGIYFTDDFAEVSEVSSDGKRLLRFNHVPLPAGLVVNGEIKDIERFKEALIGLFSSAQPGPIKPDRDAVIGVGDNRVFLREFSLAKQIKGDIDEAIDWQVKTLLPVLPAEVETDRQIIGKDANGQIEVLLAAVPKPIVKLYLDIFSDIGLNVISMEPVIFATVRMIEPLQLKGKNQMLVNIGDDFTEFIYLTNGNPRFSDFLSSDDVERKGGVVKATADNINFANSKHPSRPVTEVIVSGFSQRVKETVELLKGAKMNVTVAQSRLSSSAVKGLNLLHSANGLSLKPLLSPSSFNLLPVEYRINTTAQKLNGQWKVLLSFLIGVSVLGVLALLFLFQYTRVRLANLTNLDNSYKQELSSDSSKASIAKIGEINKLTDELLLLRSSTGGEVALLNELDSITPQGVSLSSFVYSRGTGSKSLVGPNSSWIITGNANSRELVLSFYENLRKQPDFATGKLYFGSLEKETGTIFRIASQAKK